MSAISFEIAQSIKAGNGFYKGDSDNTYGDNPRCIKIVEYRNMHNGNLSYGAVMETDRDPMRYERDTEAIRLFFKYEPEPMQPDADGWYCAEKPIPLGPIFNSDGSTGDSATFRGWLEPGHLLRFEVKDQQPLLVGHLTAAAGTCGGCCRMAPTAMVTAYRIVWRLSDTLV